MIAQIVLASFPLLMIIAGWRDMVSMTIPNWISMVMIAAFAIAAPLTGMSWQIAGLHLATGMGVLLLTMVMFALNWIGGGDAKLFAAASLWMGWPDVLAYALAAAVAGGILTVLLIILRSRPLPPVLYSYKWSQNLLKKGGDVPYGIGLCAGALFIFPQSSMFLSTIS